MPETIPRHLFADPHSKPVDFANKKVHLIGIGGCGMSAAASMLLERRAIVSGSDILESMVLQQLSAAGATVYIGHDHLNVARDVDLVVTSAAVEHDNVELLLARSLGKPTVKYAELLGKIMQSTAGVGIAGTHGKSTTTAMAAFLAREAGLDPSFVVGAVVPQLGGASGVGTGEGFIVEACEYDRSFLHFAPRSAVILNIEEDHLDYFKDLDEIVGAFSEFVRLVPVDGLVLYNHEDFASHKAARKAIGLVQSFGFEEGATWRARNLTFEDGLPHFDIEWQGRSIGRTSLAIPGKFNVCNALAACAVVHSLGGNLEMIASALPQFEGAERRLSYRGRYHDIDILDDYAHHPTELKVTLQAVRQRYTPKRLRVVFQPHQESRTRFFLDDFADSFSLADEIVVPDIYFVRDCESGSQLVTSNDLVEKIRRRGGRAKHIPDLGEIAEYLAHQAQPGDLVLTMGAGDVWKVADEMVSRLGADH